MNQFIITTYGIELIFGTALALACLVLYLSTSPWRESEMGRLIALLFAAIGAVELLTLVNLFLRPHASWIIWLDLTVFLALPLSFLWMLILLIRWLPSRRRKVRNNGKVSESNLETTSEE